MSSTKRDDPHSAPPGVRRLAAGRVGAVDRCACGTLRLHVGAVTLRLSPAALSELSGLLGEALGRLEAPPATALFGARERGEA